MTYLRKGLREDLSLFISQLLFSFLRFDLKRCQKEGVRIVTWTVNTDDDKDYFGNVLKLPFMTDHITS